MAHPQQSVFRGIPRLRAFAASRFGIHHGFEKEQRLIYSLLLNVRRLTAEVAQFGPPFGYMPSVNGNEYDSDGNTFLGLWSGDPRETDPYIGLEPLPSSERHRFGRLAADGAMSIDYNWVHAHQFLCLCGISDDSADEGISCTWNAGYRGGKKAARARF